MASFNHYATANRFFIISGLIGLLSLSARADIIEIINGDHYSGTVISMTQSNVEFRSDIQGLVKIPRDKVASINLRPAISAKPLTAPPVTAPAQPLISAPGVPKATTNAQSDAVIQQMREQGVDSKMMDQIQKQLLGTSTPETTKMFNDTVGGLMSGKLSTQDIRSQAQKALKDIQAARKDLGDDSAELLDGYAAILQKFVNETEPAATAKPAPAKPAP
jgi:hypothetical protein